MYQKKNLLLIFFYFDLHGYIKILFFRKNFVFENILIIPI